MIFIKGTLSMVFSYHYFSHVVVIDFFTKEIKNGTVEIITSVLIFCQFINIHVRNALMGFIWGLLINFICSMDFNDNVRMFLLSIYMDFNATLRHKRKIS